MPFIIQGSQLTDIFRFGIQGQVFPSAPTTNILYVSSTAQLRVGDSINIMLDTGVFFKTKITTILANGGIIISPVLPSAATAGNIVIDLSVFDNVAPSRAENSTDLGG